MNQLFLWTAVALALMLVFPLIRIVRGPTIYDRIVGAAMMGTKTMVLLLLMGFAVGRADMYVDISIGYGLALLVGHLVTAKYLEKSAERGDLDEGGAKPVPAGARDEDLSAGREAVER